jgi:hypothetical protein
VGLSELPEKPRLSIGYVATRHKGGSPFQRPPRCTGSTPNADPCARRRRWWGCDGKAGLARP